MVPGAVGGLVGQALLQHHLQLEVGDAAQLLPFVQSAIQGGRERHQQRAAQ